MHSPLEIARNYVEVGVHKTNLSAFKMLILGIFAGIFIGFAGIASTAASASVAAPSIARLVSACVFPAGMAMVLIAGSELFTGNTLIIMSVLEKRVSLYKMLKNWFWVFIGNFLGATFVGVMVVYGGTPELFNGNLTEAIVNAGAARCNLTFSQGFIRGILCNILVCIAIWMSYAAKKVSGKLITIFWPILVFVVCGFEHSIADIYFGVAAIFTAAECELYVEGLNWYNFFANCIVPVTLGNIIGGAGIVGFGYWLMYLHQTPYMHTTVEAEQEEIELAEEY